MEHGYRRTALLGKPPSSNAVADAKRAARKRARLVRVSTTAIEVVNEPKPDWKHPWEAPFYCFSGLYIHGVEAWTEALQKQVERIIETEHALQSQDDPELDGKWSFARTKGPGALIAAMGLQTAIKPGFFAVMPEDGDAPAGCDRWMITGYDKAILQELSDGGGWEDGSDVLEIAPDQKLALRWHRALLLRLFQSWEESFIDAIRLGAAHIMARKRSILAPFERLSWNQWQYFQLDEDPSQPQLRVPGWGDPRVTQRWLLHIGDLPWSATGPAGEKLYEIHIAPGMRSAQGQVSREEEVIQWLVDLLRKHPDEPPQPLPAIRQFVMRHFSELSIKGFDYCYLTACQKAGNHNWSLPGRKKFSGTPLQPPQSRVD
jgi:hypothetical protein